MSDPHHPDRFTLVSGVRVTNRQADEAAKNWPPRDPPPRGPWWTPPEPPAPKPRPGLNRGVAWSMLVLLALGSCLSMCRGSSGGQYDRAACAEKAAYAKLRAVDPGDSPAGYSSASGRPMLVTDNGLVRCGLVEAPAGGGE
jgi:hypothetical protein